MLDFNVVFLLAFCFVESEHFFFFWNLFSTFGISLLSRKVRRWFPDHICFRSLWQFLRNFLSCFFAISYQLFKKVILQSWWFLDNFNGLLFLECFICGNGSIRSFEQTRNRRFENFRYAMPKASEQVSTGAFFIVFLCFFVFDLLS